MQRRRPRRAWTIYDYARGDGWILTAQGDHEDTPLGIEFEVVLYYTDKQRVRTECVRNIDTLLQQLLDVGAKLGPYEGASPEPYTEYDEQSRAVRMQRHATDIYEAAKGARGMSPTIAVRAAEKFGSTWAEKGAADWMDRVKGVGSGRAARIVAELDE